MILVRHFYNPEAEMCWLHSEYIEAFLGYPYRRNFTLFPGIE
jgi:hypothetical protein